MNNLFSIPLFVLLPRGVRFIIGKEHGRQLLDICHIPQLKSGKGYGWSTVVYFFTNLLIYSAHY